MTIAERFHALFSGLDRAHGTTSLKGSGGAGKQQAKSYTVKEAPSPELWTRHLSGAYGLGIFPLTDEGTCHWGAIDIDVYDLDHKRLEEQVQARHLPLIVTRTKSGGAHLYLFLIEPCPARLVRQRLAEWASVLGHGGCEIFPKQHKLAGENDFGNWLNMPYHGGSRSTRYALRDGAAVTDPSAFLAYAEVMRITPAALKGIEVEQDELFRDGPPCLQTLAARGFPEGTRNEALYNVAVYMGKRYGEEIQAHLMQANQDLMKPPLPAREVQSIYISCTKRGYNFKCSQEPIVSVCQRQVCLARKFGVRGGSDSPTVLIDRLLKLETQPVTWIAELSGERMELDTATLVNQRAFRLRAAEILNMLSTVIKPDTWDRIVDAHMREAEVVAAPVDASPEGQLLNHLEDFCTEAEAMAEEELLNGLPYTIDGFTHFRSADFKLYMETKRVRGWTDREIWAVLRRMGAKQQRFEIKGKVVLTWAVPEFARQVEEFSVPDITEKGDF